MAGRGTGVPITFGCAKCRLSRAPYEGSRSVIAPVTRTGRTKKLSKPQRTNGPPRTLRERHEYRCTQCGHVGWTRHVDILRAPVKAASGTA